MKVAISGSWLRPGQQGNINWLATVLKATGALLDAEVVCERPLPWEVWRQIRMTEAAKVAYEMRLKDYDLVIAFEMGPMMRAGVSRWVDVRLHPYRWAQPAWSIETSFYEADSARIARMKLPAPATLYSLDQKADDGEICFCTQVSGDAQLLFGGVLITPQDARDDLERIARAHHTFWVVPHPLEPLGPWVEMALTLPGARMWHGTAYEAMARCKKMVTVNSSTGYEAPSFACRPIFLGPRQDYSEPYDITDKWTWRTIQVLAERGLRGPLQ